MKIQDSQIAQLSARLSAIMPILNERQVRLYLGAEAKSLGHGGAKLVSSLSGTGILFG